MTLGLYRNRSVERIKGNQATWIIHSGIILDLVCGFSGSVGEDIRADFPSSRREISFFLSVSARVRNGDPDRVCSLQVGQTWIPPRWFAPRWNVGRFIGPGRGVDKIDEFSFVLPHV